MHESASSDRGTGKVSVTSSICFICPENRNDKEMIDLPQYITSEELKETDSLVDETARLISGLQRSCSERVKSEGKGRMS